LFANLTLKFFVVKSDDNAINFYLRSNFSIYPRLQTLEMSVFRMAFA